MVKKITVVLLLIFTCNTYTFDNFDSENVSWGRRLSRFAHDYPLLWLPAGGVLLGVLLIYIQKKLRPVTRIRKIDESTWEVERVLKFDFNN